MQASGLLLLIVGGFDRLVDSVQEFQRLASEQGGKDGEKTILHVLSFRSHAGSFLVLPVTHGPSEPFVVGDAYFGPPRLDIG